MKQEQLHLKHVCSSTGAGDSPTAMLGHMRTGSCCQHTCPSGDVDRTNAVPSRAHNVQHCRLQQPVKQVSRGKARHASPVVTPIWWLRLVSCKTILRGSTCTGDYALLYSYGCCHMGPCMNAKQGMPVLKQCWNDQATWDDCMQLATGLLSLSAHV